MKQRHVSFFLISIYNTRVVQHDSKWLQVRVSNMQKKLSNKNWNTLNYTSSSTVCGSSVLHISSDTNNKSFSLFIIYFWVKMYFVALVHFLHPCSQHVDITNIWFNTFWEAHLCSLTINLRNSKRFGIPLHNHPNLLSFSGRCDMIGYFLSFVQII